MKLQAVRIEGVRIAWIDITNLSDTQKRYIPASLSVDGVLETDIGDYKGQIHLSERQKSALLECLLKLMSEQTDGGPS